MCAEPVKAWVSADSTLCCLQESNQQLTNSLNEANKELEALRAEVVKKAKKRAKNQRSACTQCELSYLEDSAPQHSLGHSNGRQYEPEQSRIPHTDARPPPAAAGGAQRGWTMAPAPPHVAKVMPTVTRHNAPQVRCSCRYLKAMVEQLQVGVPLTRSHVRLGVRMAAELGVVFCCLSADLHQV